MDNKQFVSRAENRQDAKTTSARSRRFQFSLLFLLVLVFIVAVVALIASRVSDSQRRRRDRDEYVEALAAVGARYNAQGQCVTFFRNSGDRSLAVLPIAVTRPVTIIDLTGTRITDVAVSEMADQVRENENWEGPDDLRLANTGISNRAMEQIGTFKLLEKLDVHGTDIDDDGLKYLLASPAMKQLNLKGTRVTDAGLEHLGTMKKLEWLFLTDTAVDGSGFRHLKDCESLKALVIEPSQISDESLEHLKNINLRSPHRASVLIAGEISDDELASVRKVLDPIGVDRLPP